MEISATPPWETKTKTVKRGLLRKLLLWGFFIGLIGFVAYGLKAKPIPVETASVTRGPLTVSVLEEGKTRIRNRYVVAAPVSGNMRRVTLKAGDEVKANETVLTVIEPGLAPLLDARSQAQAEARIAGATAARAQAEQSLEMARTSAQFARAGWDRVKSNATVGSISITDRDNIEREALMRDREVRAGEFALKVADFELAQAKAALLQLTKPEATGAVVEVRAPVSGRVLKVQQESAMIVAAGTPLLEVGDPADLEIEAEILSRDAVAIRVGAEVLVEQWGGEAVLKARVRRIEPAAFTKVSALGVEEQRVIVLSDLDSPPESARVLGDRYRVEVRVAVWKDADVLLVPSGALFREGREWKTFVLRAGKAAEVVVQTGRTDGKVTQVLGGLNVGDLVLMHPPDVVADGSDVVQRVVE
jgi:HlyD family secretion protein